MSEPSRPLAVLLYCTIAFLLLYLYCVLAGLSVNQQDNGNTSVKAPDTQHVIPEDSSSTGGLSACVLI